jgi:hypothetical protein
MRGIGDKLTELAHNDVNLREKMVGVETEDGGGQQQRCRQQHKRESAERGEGFVGFTG